MDEGEKLGSVLRGGGVAESEGVGDTACELFGIVAIGPRVGEAGLLEEPGVLAEAVFERVEVLEESIDGVVPASGRLGLADGHDFLRCYERAIRGIEVLVSEDEDGLALPVAAAGDTKEVEPADTGFTPSALEDGLCGDELGRDVGGPACCLIDFAHEGAL